MTEPYDCGDVVSYGPEVLIVACCHEDYVRPCGQPNDRTIHASRLTLISKASPTERQEQLKMLAQSTGSGHRPECARRTLRRECGESD